jgi:hypothetical protein
MGCPNSKNRPKKGLRPLGVSVTILFMFCVVLCFVLCYCLGLSRKDRCRSPLTPCGRRKTQVGDLKDGVVLIPFTECLWPTIAEHSSLHNPKGLVAILE